MVGRRAKLHVGGLRKILPGAQLILKTTLVTIYYISIYFFFCVIVLGMTWRTETKRFHPCQTSHVVVWGFPSAAFCLFITKSGLQLNVRYFVYPEKMFYLNKPRSMKEDGSGTDGKA